MASLLHRAVRGLARLSMRGHRRGPHITRYSMYRRLAEVFSALPREGRVLAVSGSRPLCEAVGLGHLDIVEGNFPDVDLRSLPYDDGSFDFVVTDQVLEHVEGDPQRAMDEARRVLRPGGFALHTTCFMNQVHGAPNDYWRFTPEALRLLARNYGRVVECGGWGNPYVWLYNSFGLRHEGVPEASWHPVNRLATLNRPDWPITTWVVAQRV